MTQYPVPNSTLSFWRTELHDFDNHRTTEKLPAEADIVIIGAGYAGASIAYHLLEKSNESGKNVSIAILEAREACSGATGRNGGHLKPDPYYRAAGEITRRTLFQIFLLTTCKGALRKYGRDAAEEVSSFEQRHVKAIKELVEKENIDCDFVVTRATDVCLYEDIRKELKSGLEALTAANISSAAEVHYSDGRTAEGISGVKGAKGCFTYTAGHVWPYKLILSLLSKVVSRGVNLQTHTPVKSVKSTKNQRHPWSIETDRGSVKASKVIYATNAYTSTLLPEFKKKIIPVRGICSRIVPTKAHAPFLSNSYILRLSPMEYDYLIPRSDGSIVVGGARRDYFRDLDQWYDNIDDSKLIEPAKNYFDGYMQRHFRGWEDSGAYTDKVWTGIMGYSSDGFPFVGDVPGKPGAYVCAGFSGHGMPQIFLSGKAIAEMVLDDRKADEVDLPRLYRVSQARLDAKGDVTLDAWKAMTGNSVQAKL
ncbi:Gamma-glutamylputrescine oxidoreductase [Pseudocercospora fuligena]|uniref:Gamma-glutamylputrescine oxidoreductase n=1 Tax=Pseudocercospora fuligena TaxID=685502 RepID=A0A8H6RV52_9PEZI|nr:Gamma-glutamylputrescine oxidoreductase [Pseudocercospora fuligena]